MTELEKAARMALEALNLAWAAHGQMLMSDPPQEAWKAWNVSTAIRESMIALRQALEQEAQQESEAVRAAWMAGYTEGEREALEQPAIKQSLTTEQPAQEEPRGWQWLDTAVFRKKLPDTAEPGAWHPLYTRPQAREPLSREKAMKIVEANPDIMTAIRMTEAAHGIEGEKNGTR